MEISNTTNEYLKEILRYSPLVKKDIKYVLSKVLGNDLVKTIEQHNTSAVLAVYASSEGLRILKIEAGAPPQKTIKEIHWYRTLQNSRNVSQTPSFFGGLYNKNIAVYELEFLDKYALFEDLIINDNINETQIQGYIMGSLDLMTVFFTSKQSRFVSFEEGETLYWLKIKQRVKEASNIPWLKELLQQRIVIINDKEFPGIPLILETLSKEVLRRKITPCRWGFVHGDIHFGNIMVNEGKIKLIDPNGKLELPIEYDIGKLLHSLHGNYNYIHRGRFSLEARASPHEYVFKINTASKEYRWFEEIFRNRFSEEVVLRSLFSECCHFLTMLPHHTKDREETTALYLQTIILFQDLLRKLKD